MVISTTINGTTIYLHAAYATDEHGSDFSLTEFAGAVYVGNYSDQSATESNDWRSYTWQLIGDEVVDSDEIEAFEDLEPSEITDVEDSINEINETTGDVETRTLNNNDNLQLTQNDVNQGIGNLNLLSGTNQGAQNWTSGSSTLTDYSTAIYNDDDVVNAMHAVIVSGSDTLEFDANSLNDFISNNAEINTFTLSYDMNVSNASGTFTVESSGVLNFDAPDFTTDDPLEDFAGAWVHFISTTELTSGTPTETVLKFIYSGSANDTIDIANLKIEAGADATPWRASLAEVESTANTALSTANTAASDAATALAAAQAVNNYFWHDSSGAHVTQVTQTQYQGDPANAGGNTLITSSGLNVLDGTTTLASFGSTGAQIGQSSSGHTAITSGGMEIYGYDGTVQLANVGYGPGIDAGGSVSDAPYFSFGIRRTGTTVGNYSTAEGYDNIGSGYVSHVEGLYNAANNFASHAEGAYTVASGSEAHAEGYSATASGNYSHAEGALTKATAQAAHAQNTGTIASSANQTVIGKYNVEDNADTYAFILGNGTGIGSRSNALTTKWNGDVSTAGDVSAVDVSASGDISAGGDATITGDISGDDITASGDITATGDISAANATLTGTMTVGRDPTSNLEVATKKYVDDNSGGGGWTPTHETIRNGISITTTSTNYGTNNIPLSNYKFIELRVYSSSAMSSEIYPIETIKAQVNNVYINHGQVCRLGSTNVYLTWKYNDDTHLQMNVNTGSTYYVGIFGIK